MKAPFLKRLFALVIISICHLCGAASAQAETPILEPGDYTDLSQLDQVQWIPNAKVMWFVLGELQSEQDVDVVQFDYPANERFFAQIFIAENDDLRDFHPSIALIGKGLPEPNTPLPFALPPGMGAVVAHSNTHQTYYDIFTQMSYYPRAKVEMPLPQSGRYYVAVFGLPQGSARYALDIGVTEDWALSVVARYPINWYQVRTFFGWSLWPGLALPISLLGLGAWLTKRRNRKQSNNNRAMAWGFGSASVVSLWVLGLAQSAGADNINGSVVFFVLLIGFAALLTFLCGAYLLTPLRERLTPQAYARAYKAKHGYGNCYTQVQGYAIHFSDDGPKDGLPIILIHGFAASMFSWRHQREQLLQQGYRVIAIDLLGCGGSARAAEAIYTTPEQAESVLGVMDAVGLSSAIIAGHSFGARVAMQMALLAPTRVQQLILICAEAIAAERPGIAKLVRIPIFGYALAFYSTAPFLVRTGLKIMSASEKWINKEAVLGYQLPLHVTGSALAQEWQSRSAKDGEKPVPKYLGEITHPTLLIWGEQDKVFPVSEAQQVKTAMLNATLHIIPKTGHLVHEEESDAVSRLMVEWVREARSKKAEGRMKKAE